MSVYVHSLKAQVSQGNYVCAQAAVPIGNSALATQRIIWFLRVIQQTSQRVINVCFT